MKIDDTYVSASGVLRCCALSLVKLAEQNPNADFTNGAVVHCTESKRRASHKLMLWNGTWRWLDPRSAELEQREELRKKGQLVDHVRGRTLD